MDNKNKAIMINSALLLISIVIIGVYSFLPIKDSKKNDVFNLVFDTLGGSKIVAIEINEGEIPKVPDNPTREGYVFKGWMIGDEEYHFDKPITKDTKLTAKWEKKKEDVVYLKVTFDTLDPAVTVDPNPFEVEKGGLVIKPVDPIREGFEFVEWQYNGVAFDFNTPITADITLTAVWKEIEKEPEPEEPEEEKPKVKKYKVTFDTQGGSRVSTVSVEEGKKVRKPSNPKKVGYRFKEWTLNGSPYNFNTPVTQNIKLVATYEMVKYNVVVKKNNGSVCVTESIQEGQTFTIPGNCVEKIPRHDFAGWSSGSNSFVVRGNTTVTPKFKVHTYSAVCTLVNQIGGQCRVDATINGKLYTGKIVLNDTAGVFKNSTLPPARVVPIYNSFGNTQYTITIIDDGESVKIPLGKGGK